MAGGRFATSKESCATFLGELDDMPDTNSSKKFIDLPTQLPKRLYFEGKLNMFCLHEVFRYVAAIVVKRLRREYQIDVPITSGLWGGAYLVGDREGRVISRVIRYYSMVNLPQNSPLDKGVNFESLMKLYHQTCQGIFKNYGLYFENPQWGEPVFYTNNIRPTTTLQMWEQNTEVQFLRAFFVWNSASWEESLIFDTLRNIKQLKELIDPNRRPLHKAKEELRFALQDLLICYHTLHDALSPEFIEHAEPYMRKLLGHFLPGLHDPDRINELFYKAYSEGYVYGFEEALEGPYKKFNLDIRRVEDWPVDKINWVPEVLKEKLVPPLRDVFLNFKDNLESGKKFSRRRCPFLHFPYRWANVSN